MKQLFSVLLAVGMCFTGYRGYTQASGNILLPVRHAGSDAAAVRATGHFWNTFGESRDEKWYVLPKGLVAQFVDKDVQVKVVYGKKGDWVYTMRQYTEKDLPKEVRGQVKSRYYDDTIGVIKEVIQPQGTVYLIHIENDTRWKTIRVSEGELEVVQDFKKR